MRQHRKVCQVVRCVRWSGVRVSMHGKKGQSVS